MTITRDTAREERRPGDERARPASRKANNYRTSKLATVGLVAAALAFVALCLLVALGGGKSDEPASRGTAPVVRPASDDVESAGVAPGSPADTSDTNQQPGPSAVVAEDEEHPTEEDEPANQQQTTNQDEPANQEQTTNQDEPANQEPIAEEDEPSAVAVTDGPRLEPPPAPPGVPERYSISSEGKLFLIGTVPSTEAEDEIVRSLESIIGEGNVISVYTVDPDFQFDPTLDTPFYTDGTVVFETMPLLVEIESVGELTILGHDHGY